MKGGLRLKRDEKRSLKESESSFAREVIREAILVYTL